MPDSVSHPGVSVEEGPARVPPIAGVRTDIAAFVGWTASGPVDEPVQVDDFASFTSTLGGLHADSPLSHAVSHFFANGGTTAWVVRRTAPGGGPPAGPAGILGRREAGSGVYALAGVDHFALLNLPGVAEPGVLAAALGYATERRAMLFIDLPAGRSTVAHARAWIREPAIQPLRQANAIACFPRLRIADPARGGELASFPNSGAMAGLYARNDRERGVWKAPAGVEARLHGVAGLDCLLSNEENGLLNPLGLNCLRSLPVHGVVAWGARTLDGADELASEWKYVPVRRTALFIEESLGRGTRFAVFEPNGEPLWARLREVVGEFMERLFRQGAFQGRTPREAWLVKCDASTTTQADIDQGVVNVMVGFAPLKPAEFVIIRIQQKTATS